MGVCGSSNRQPGCPQRDPTPVEQDLGKKADGQAERYAGMPVETSVPTPSAAATKAEEEIVESDEEVFSCSTPGCSRPTWNGQAGELCCRTCGANSARFHGPDCDQKFKKACTHIICVGNPGAGKSTLLNTMIRKVVFKNGFSVFQCVTTKCDDHEYDGCVYVDSPGVADISIREQAAKELAAGLNMGDWCKILFVVTLQGGYLRAEDLATMELVLESLLNAGLRRANLSFSVVINKSQEDQISLPKFIECFVGEPGKERDPVQVSLSDKFVHIAHDPSIEDDSDKFINLTDEFKSRIANLPSMNMKKKIRDIEVKADMFEHRIRAYKAQIEEMEKEAKKQQVVFEQIAKQRREDTKDTKKKDLVQDGELLPGLSFSPALSRQGPAPPVPRARREHVLCIGNKGVGTTTIKGLVEQHMKPLYKQKGIELEFVELQGLADARDRVETATAIELQLKKGNCHVFFIITLEAGRLRAEDQKTIELVLDAVPILKSHFSVIINRVTGKSTHALREDSRDFFDIKKKLLFPENIWMVEKSRTPQLPANFAREFHGIDLDEAKVNKISAETPESLRNAKKKIDDKLHDSKAFELANRGITLEALLDFYEDIPKYMPHFDPDTSTTQDVTRQVIIPRSWSGIMSQDGQALAPVLEKRLLASAVLVTHTWTNPFAYTVAAMIAHALDMDLYLDSVIPLLKDAQKRRNLKKTLKKGNKLSMRFWFCAVSVNQHANICGSFQPQPQDPGLYASWDRSRRDTVLLKQNKDSLIKTCTCQTKKYFNDQPVLCELNKFDAMMYHMKNMDQDFGLVLAVDPDFMVFERIWCMAELVECGRREIRISIKLPSKGHCDANMKRLQDVRIENCKATRDADVEDVLGKLKKDGDGAIDKFNRELQQVLGHVKSHIGSCDSGSHQAAVGKKSGNLVAAILRLQILTKEGVKEGKKGQEQTEALDACRGIVQAFTNIARKRRAAKADLIVAENYEKLVDAVKVHITRMDKSKSDAENARNKEDYGRVNKCLEEFFDNQVEFLQAVETTCANQVRYKTGQKGTLTTDAVLMQTLFEFVQPTYVWDEVMTRMLGQKHQLFETHRTTVTLPKGGTVSTCVFEIPAITSVAAKCGYGKRCDGTKTWFFPVLAFEFFREQDD